MTTILPLAHSIVPGPITHSDTLDTPMPLPPDLAAWRKEQRATLLRLRMAVDRAQHAIWNQQITTRLLELCPAEKPMTVAGYWPFKGEFDPRFAMRIFRDHGMVTALPVVVQTAAALQFRPWWPGLRTSPGVYGLPVPEGIPVEHPDVVLMPPIGFDTGGYRLGYGGGYYDRTLADMPGSPIKIGVAFELSRIASIRPQPHDIPMDYVVTEEAIYQVTPTGLARRDGVQAQAHWMQLRTQRSSRD